MRTINIEPVSEETKQKFWAKVIKSESPDGCWMWIAAKDHHGYGHLNMNRVHVRAHRLSLLIAGRELPEGQSVCHSCDVPACVNPAHLWLGSHMDNMVDRCKKGRTATGIRSGAVKHPEATPRGEGHCRAKLNEEKVRAMREEYAKGGINLTDLGAKYGIKMVGAWQVVNRDTWAHVK